MTGKATTWAWAQQLAAPSKLLLLALADMAGGDEHRVNLDTAVDTLTRRTGLARRTVQYHLRQLEQSGHVVAEARTDHGGKRLPNRWHLNVNGLAPVPLAIATTWTDPPPRPPAAPSTPPPAPDPDAPLDLEIP